MEGEAGSREEKKLIGILYFHAIVNDPVGKGNKQKKKKKTIQEGEGKKCGNETE